LVDTIELSQSAIDCEVPQSFKALMAATDDIDKAPIRIVLMVENGAHGLEQ